MLVVIAGMLFYIYQLERKESNGGAYADSILFVILCTYVMTEIYSIVHLLTRKVILATWICLVLILLILIVINRKKDVDYHRIIESIKEKELRNTKIILGVICVWGGVFLSAKSITANWDSMTYHMPRIMHWIQNKSTAFYATSEIRQITSPPLAEYMIMHIMMLTGNDKFVCMVQGASYVLSAGLIYSLSGKMKIGKPYACFAVFLFLMMPPAIAESVTTQNDLFTALIMLLFFHYYLEFIYSPDLNISKEKILLSVKTGATIALGYLAKSYVLIPMGILILYLGVITIMKKEKIRNILVVCGTGIGTAVAGVLPFFIQSYRVYGSLFPKAQTEGIMPKTFSIKLLIANCYKNLAQYVSTPYLSGFNDFLMKVGRGIEKVFHIDINDTAISTMEFRLPDNGEVYHHDMATNPVIIFLCVLVLAGIIFKVCIRTRLETGMFLCIVSGLLVTAALSKYSIWKVRYFLSASAVAVILITFFIERIHKKYRWREYFIGFILCLSLLNGYGAFYYTRDAVRAGYYGNEDGDYSYFVGNKIRGSYNDIAAYIGESGYKDIGIYMRGNSYEYPLWVYLDQVERMEHVMVGDEYLRKLEDVSYVPECIISINKGECILEQTMEYHGHNYVCSYISVHDSQYGVFVIQSL